MNKWFFITGSVIAVLCIFTRCAPPVNEYALEDRPPRIFPDYASVVIPCNIAPLNFEVREEGSRFQVEIHPEKGKAIILRQSSPVIRIPVRRWQRMLEENKGSTFAVHIYTKKKKWHRYATITDTIATEPVDNYLAYRKIGISYTYYNKLGIYQRNLSNFDVSAIFENTSREQKPCMNCHSFCNYDPGKMSLHVRRYNGGTVIFNEGELNKYDTKTKYALSPASYTAWHPGGELIAYTSNQMKVNFTSVPAKAIEVWDNASDLMLFNVKTNTITTSPKISTGNRENLPCWSADGKWLYFITAKKAPKDTADFMDYRYSLVRIPFDAPTMVWGEADTVLSAAVTGKSITFPAVSPDGRYVLFCMIDHGYFSVFDINSDLYLLDLTTRVYRKADALNSPSTDSWHAWSKNGRWVVFSSKRMDDLCSRPYFAYFDNRGSFHKPFVLPQKNPGYYGQDTWNFNLPVFVEGKVGFSPNTLRDFLSGEPKKSVFKGETDALTGATLTQ